MSKIPIFKHTETQTAHEHVKPFPVERVVFGVFPINRSVCNEVRSVVCQQATLPDELFRLYSATATVEYLCVE